MEPSGKEEKRQAEKHLASRSRDWDPPGVKSKEKHRTVAEGLSSKAYTLRGVIGVSNYFTFSQI